VSSSVLTWTPISLTVLRKIAIVIPFPLGLPARETLEPTIAAVEKIKPKEPSGGEEKRKYRRAPFMVLEVKGKHFEKIFVGYAENISPGGLFLSAAQPMKVGERFPVEFVLPDNVTMIRCTCEVVWKKRYDLKGMVSEGMGIRFVDLNQAKRKAITDWVKRQENKKNA